MSFFKAYDMRGTFEVDFDLTTVYRVGRALPEALRECNGDAARSDGRPLRVLVGRDCRTSSAAIRAALVAGLRSRGVEVVDLGCATTPLVYFFTAEEDFDGSVMITASHNPPGDNGLKVSRRGALPMGYESGLAAVERAISQDRAVWSGSAALDVTEGTDGVRLSRYLAWLRAHASGDFSNLRFAVDCSDGMASILAHELFPGAVFLNDTPNGSFPHHSPNPLLEESRRQLVDVVRAQGLDCGVIFDGDADRCMFVDERGDFIQPDYLIPALAASFPTAPVVIHDVRTSRAVIEALRERGSRPVMGKVGHAYAKVLLRQVDAVCGGELAGHYYFRDFHGCDSGAFAALRILGQFACAKRRGETVSRALAPIRERYANSGEMNFQVADKTAAISRVLQTAARFGREIGRCSIDGVRLEFDDGWISVRSSNTEPYLRLLIECADAPRLAQWRDALARAVTAS